jgi:RNA polymerase sigma factor (TIGR02999 family)
MPLMDAQIETLFATANSGDQKAREELFQVLYTELHRLARHELARNGGKNSLGVTTLLHEAYLVVSARERLSYTDRGRFMAYVARAMRGLIIDYARRRQAQKRGGNFEITSLGTTAGAQCADHGELERIADALEELTATEPALAEIVDLKFYCGLSFAEIAVLRAVSERTVQRDWEKARIYLYRALQDDSALT